MRISNYSNIYYIRQKVYLYNLVEGNVDRVSSKLASKFDHLKKEGSFELYDSGLLDNEINKLLHKGYFSVYSNWEEAKENNKKIKKKRTKAKLQNKTICININSDNLGFRILFYVLF